MKICIGKNNIFWPGLNFFLGSLSKYTGTSIGIMFDVDMIGEGQR